MKQKFRAPTIALLFALQATSVISAQTQARSIEGVVIRSGTDEPVPQASVELWRVVRSNGQTGQILQTRAATDVAGKFGFVSLPEGEYRIIVEGDGYIPQWYGASRSGRTESETASLILLDQDSRLHDARISVVTNGVIAGRVSSNTGEPAVGVGILLFSEGYDAKGAAVHLLAGSAETNDRGEYRLLNVNPGRYYLGSATSAFFFRNMGASEFYTPATGLPGAPSLNIITRVSVGFPPIYAATYYPGTTDASRAMPIEVAAGVKMLNMDFALKRQGTDQKFRIRGRVIDAATGQIPTGELHFTLLPRNARFLHSIGMSRNPYSPDGTFELNDVAVGEYWVFVRNSRILGGAPTPSIVWAPVDVRSDVDGLVLSLATPTSVSGQIKIEDETAKLEIDLRSLQVRLVPRNVGGMSMPFASSRTGSIDSSGSLVITNVSRGGEYRLMLMNLPAGVYIKEARSGTTNLLAEELLVKDVPDPIQIVLSKKGARIEGVLSGEKPENFKDALVVLIPDSRAPAFYYTAALDSAGTFMMTGVAPGDYKLFAWESLELYRYFDREFVQKSETQGQPLHVTDSAVERVNLGRLLPAQP